ncbi:hypothetical protein WJX74_000541 [Apatococcus lobatus]|uniref:Uncharacterized protein n=1 Tax=Apatococcus lobatus TaxID=904363 RepID=A0AAW1R096_9CHLO
MSSELVANAIEDVLQETGIASSHDHSQPPPAINTIRPISNRPMPSLLFGPQAFPPPPLPGPPPVGQVGAGPAFPPPAYDHQPVVTLDDYTYNQNGTLGTTPGHDLQPPEPFTAEELAELQQLHPDSTGESDPLQSRRAALESSGGSTNSTDHLTPAQQAEAFFRELESENDGLRLTQGEAEFMRNGLAAGWQPESRDGGLTPQQQAAADNRDADAFIDAVLNPFPQDDTEMAEQKHIIRRRNTKRTMRKTKRAGRKRK